MAIEFAGIGGSQAYDLIKKGTISGKRVGEIATPFGFSQPIYQLSEGSTEFYFLSRHGEKGYTLTAPYVNYRANIFALKELGVKQIISWSGPGTINTKYRIGQYVVIDDLIDETKQRKSTFYENKGWGFIRQSPVFCSTLRKLTCEALTNLKYDFSDSGVYVCTEGPRLETPAEIRKYASFGCDLVGMTLVPEVFLARELEMCYAAICYVTNYAEGIASKPFKPGELFEGLSDEEERKAVGKAVTQFPSVLREIAKNIGSAQKICNCHDAMQRYKKAGIIGNDWHDWVK